MRRQTEMTLAYLEHYTAKDYELWKGDWELIYGAPYAMTPSPGISHQRIEKKILIQVENQLSSCAKCEAFVELDWYCLDDTVVRPDVLVVCHHLGEKLTRTPELIVEVVSPSSVQRDENLKFELYQKEAVKTYILVYPELKKAKVYQWLNGQYQKVGDFFQETYAFSISGCKLEIDFSKTW